MILKQLRQQRNISQTKLAEILGIDRGMLSLYENNKIKSIPLDNMIKIADFFDISLDDLMERKQRTFKYDRFSRKQLELIDEIQMLNDEQVAKVIGYVDALSGVGAKTQLTSAQLELLNSVSKLSDKEIARVSGYAEAVAKQQDTQNDNHN